MDNKIKFRDVVELAFDIEMPLDWTGSKVKIPAGTRAVVCSPTKFNEHNVQILIQGQINGKKIPTIWVGIRDIVVICMA